MPDVELNLDGHPSRLTVNAAEIETVHLPVLHALEQRWRERRGRFVVLLGGPPGSGKTTLAGLWEHLAGQGRIVVPIQCLSMDGFHYPNRVSGAQCHSHPAGIGMGLGIVGPEMRRSGFSPVHTVSGRSLSCTLLFIRLGASMR